MTKRKSSFTKQVQYLFEIIQIFSEISKIPQFVNNFKKILEFIDKDKRKEDS